MEVSPLGLVVGLLPLAVLAFVLYVLWNMLQTLQSIDRSIPDLAKNLRNQR